MQKSSFSNSSTVRASGLGLFLMGSPLASPLQFSCTLSDLMLLRVGGTCTVRAFRMISGYDAPDLSYEEYFSRPRAY